MVLKIAHRGASKYAPENTLEAFRKAIKLKADVVEFDVRQTKDGRIVVMHDDNVARTTDGSGLIKNLTFKEIRKFHLPNGELVPTLQETFDVLKNKCICKIHIKDRFIENKIDKIIKRNHIENSVMITSVMNSSLKKIKKIFPKIKIAKGGFKTRISIEDLIKKAKRVKANIVGVHCSIITKKIVEELHKNGLEVHVWPVNDKRTIKKMKKIGVDGITTKCPDEI